MKRQQNLPPRVLVVDDAPGFRQVARELLQLRGCTVVGEAETTARGRQMAAELLPDAVLLDVHLPDGNGLELAAELARLYPSMAVLLVSAQQFDRELCHRHPRHRFVTKCELAKFDFGRFWPPAILTADPV